MPLGRGGLCHLQREPLQPVAAQAALQGVLLALAVVPRVCPTQA
jgi:hypothetical protein